MIVFILIVGLNVQGGYTSPISLTSVNKHNVDLDLVENEGNPENLNLDFRSADFGIDGYKQFISTKTEEFDKETKEMNKQMEAMEGDLLAKLSQLETQLENKQQEEKTLKQEMDKMGIQDSEDFDKLVGENIVDSNDVGEKISENMIISPYWIKDLSEWEEIKNSTVAGPYHILQ
ncbi:uncharacterized protein LOC111718373 isoform X3 [Eurytemora carolleeae]|uniref:uncharacterized protein LOC111718373 isoform X1 n=1 Tax=Eurytemora carolleeae TaxID=1294199 RepID=UPI000C7656CF|nr:uncharacterized protein LOC111718373 isoform X1 [Eurytemora carolleeae]XP_023349713.1 uncharacterized protein LOC111718373 isoform X3 [Eurytemora carolleeae]|eukprot:XP_023349711.1 uncharacterized protein LOC111718373 isoform X1 [Eurytemora affinis]